MFPHLPYPFHLCPSNHPSLPSVTSSITHTTSSLSTTEIFAAAQTPISAYAPPLLEQLLAPILKDFSLEDWLPTRESHNAEDIIDGRAKEAADLAELRASAKDPNRACSRFVHLIACVSLLTLRVFELWYLICAICGILLTHALILSLLSFSCRYRAVGNRFGPLAFAFDWLPEPLDLGDEQRSQGLDIDTISEAGSRCSWTQELMHAKLGGVVDSLQMVRAVSLTVMIRLRICPCL